MERGYNQEQRRSEVDRARDQSKARAQSTSELSALERFYSKYQVLTHQTRPNSEVGTAQIDGRTVFFKQRSRSILLEEMKAADVMREIGFECPENLDFDFDATSGVLVQEHIKDIWNKNLRGLIESQDHDKLSACFRFAYEASLEHLGFSTTLGANDRFFHERLQPSGRMEQRYESATFSLGRLNTSFKELKNSRFCIDEVQYQETLGELIEQAKEICSPQNTRAMWLSHGDFVEANVYRTDNESHPWGLIDLEVSGLNWAASDIVIPLVGFAYMFDYTLPKYSPDADHGVSYTPRPHCNVTTTTGLISIDGVGRFYTSIERKLACATFIETFANPLATHLESKTANMTHSLNDQLKALFFSRLFATHDITKWSPNDQARALGLVIKVCGTPTNGEPQAILTTFKEAL